MENRNKSKGSSLRLNLIFNIIYQGIIVVMPLIVTPKFSRVMGVDYVGLKSFTFSIVYYFAIFGTLGLDIYGQRCISINKDNVEKRSRIFAVISLLRFILCFISTLVFSLSFIIFNEDPLMKKIYLCWMVYLIREMINPIWYLQGIEKYKVISIIGIISQIAYGISVFLFVNSKDDITIYILFYTVLPLLSAVLMYPFVLKDIVRVKIAFKDFIPTLKESFIYFIPTIAAALYSMIDKTMLGLFDASKVNTGYYEQAEKLVKVALAFSTASFTIMRARLSYVYENSEPENYKSYCRNFISLSLFLCWPIMFGIIGISKDFVPLFFGDGYEAVVLLGQVFSLVVPCLTISGLLQAIYIFPLGLQKKMNFYYIIILCVNIVLNLSLIPFIQSYGAVIASITAELLLAIILTVKSRKTIEIRQFLFGSVKYIIASVLMCAEMLVISRFLELSLIYKIIIEFVCGCATYFVLCLIMCDKFFIAQIKKVFGLLKKKKDAVE